MSATSMDATEAGQQAIQRANVAFELRRFEFALREAQRAASLLPLSAAPLTLQALCWLRLKNPGEAVKLTTEALRLEPGSEYCYEFHAIALLASSESEAALLAIDQAIRLSPSTMEPHVVRSQILEHRGLLDDAITAAEAALALGPTQVSALDQLGRLLLNRDPKRAEALFLQALHTDPGDALLLNNLGVALERQQRMREAAKVFKAAIQADPTLQLAKDNTRTAVTRWAAPAAGGALAIGAKGLFATKGAAVIVASQSSQFLHGFSNSWGAWLVLGTLLAIVAVFVIGVALVRPYRLRQLKREDPALWALFQQLEKDAKHAR